MKAFVLFPTICVFVFTFTLIKLSGITESRSVLLRSLIVTAVVDLLMIWFSGEGFFLYYGNWIGILILIPCFTYLGNTLFKNNTDKIKWIRILGLTIFSTVLTIVIFATVMFFSFAYNPMDRKPKQEYLLK